MRMGEDEGGRRGEDDDDATRNRARTGESARPPRSRRLTPVDLIEDEDRGWTGSRLQYAASTREDLANDSKAKGIGVARGGHHLCQCHRRDRARKR